MFLQDLNYKHYALAFLVSSAIIAIGLGANADSRETSCKDCNVLLISVDTLRADHLGAYGYHRNTSPNIDRLADKGVVFENAYSTSSHTMSSHFSIFTSMYPRNHKVRAPKPGKKGFSKRFRMAAEIFNSSGYRTLSYNGGANLRGGLGFRRGFEIYKSNYVKQSIDPTGNLDEGLKFIKNRLNKSSEPFFMFFHTYKVHDPYYPPQNYTNLFPGFNRSIRKKSNNHLRKLQKNKSRDFADYRHRWAFVAPRMTKSKKWKQHMISSYDSDIRFTDRYVGKILGLLKKRGLRKNTVVIFISDHGEQFGEHGNWYHGNLYQEEIHVPLIIDIPEKQSGRRKDIVSTVDVIPTVMDIVGISSQKFQKQKDGVSLLPVLKDKDLERKYISASSFLEEEILIDTEIQTKYFWEKFKRDYAPNKTRSWFPFQKVDGFERIYRWQKGRWERFTNRTLLESMARINDNIRQNSSILREKLKNLDYVQ